MSIIPKPLKLSIIAIGEEEFIESMRVAGINDVIIVDETKDVSRIAQEVLEKISMERKHYGVVILSSSISKYVKPIIEKLLPEIIPLVLEIPGPRDIGRFDIKEFYSSIARRFIGFTIGLPEG